MQLTDLERFQVLRVWDCSNEMFRFDEACSITAGFLFEGVRAGSFIFPVFHK
jgi:uncharacterized protein (DUF58 family)